MKHTPGPWKVESRSDKFSDIYCYVIRDADNYILGTFWPTAHGKSVAVKFAAVPELLKTLRNIIWLCGSESGFQEVLRNIRDLASAAIADFADIIGEETAAPKQNHALLIVATFLKDLVRRPRTSASMQRIGTDADEVLAVVDAAIAKAEKES